MVVVQRQKVPGFARASLFLAGNRPVQAEQDLRMVVKQQPEQPEAWGELARSLQLQGRLDEALTAGRRAVRLNSRHAGFRINLRLILEGLGRIDEAATAYREAIGLDARSAAAWNNLGNALGKLDRFDEAEAAFHRALEFGEQPLIRTNLAAMLKRRGRLDEAAEACRRALYAAPDSIEIRVTLAAIENDRDQPGRARTLGDALSRPESLPPRARGHVCLPGGGPDQALV
ncbi:MAG: tetratricopeptide repeat protein [Wenzhouxiangella sp.]